MHNDTHLWVTNVSRQSTKWKQSETSRPAHIHIKSWKVFGLCGIAGNPRENPQTRWEHAKSTQNHHVRVEPTTFWPLSTSGDRCNTVLLYKDKLINLNDYQLSWDVNTTSGWLSYPMQFFSYVLNCNQTNKRSIKLPFSTFRRCWWNWKKNPHVQQHPFCWAELRHATRISSPRWLCAPARCPVWRCQQAEKIGRFPLLAVLV